MSISVYLTASEDAESPELHLSMGQVLPPFWLALFEKGDLRASAEDDGWPLLVSHGEPALARLQQRGSHLLSLFGEHTSGVLFAFSETLQAHRGSNLVLDATDMGLQFCRTADLWEKELVNYLSAFEEAEPRVAASLFGGLFGGSSQNYNAGWTAYFNRFNWMKARVRSRGVSPQELAGGSDDGDKPWE